MRSVLVCLLVALAACGGRDRDPVVDRALDPSEQAKFDNERHPEKIVVALGVSDGSRVADIGGGTGLLTVHIARAVAPHGKVVATDVNSDVLALMKQRIADAKLSDVVEERLVQAEEPGLEKGAYDVILLAEVDNYFNDPVAWLKAAIPALKPKGKIVIENRVHRRAKSLEAAQKAGLKLVDESNPVPSHFLAVFQP